MTRLLDLLLSTTSAPRRDQGMSRPLRALLLIFLVWAPATLSAQSAPEANQPPQVGPAHGTVIAAGGGPLGSEIWERFVALAGGENARIVVIPTAATDDEFADGWDGYDALLSAGASNLAVLHTRDRTEADSEDFVAPLHDATGVWIPGGRQHRLVDSYLHSRVHQALFEVLARGGVVGGTSAGASILASFLVRGDPETNQVVMSPEYLEGFSLLQGTAIDQHLLARNREDDLWNILDEHPEILGIGLDEGTAIVIRADRAEVIGASQVLIYDATVPIVGSRTLHPGDVFDLGARSPVPAGSATPIDGASSSSR